MARPIFQNEILGVYNGTNEPQYDITHSGGLLSNAKLILKNNIMVTGTPQNADNMNNLFAFDNLASMRNNTRITVFNADGSITENIKDTVSGIINAKRVTTFSGNTIVEKITVYDDSGTLILRNTTTTTTLNADGSITEVIA